MLNLFANLLDSLQGSASALWYSSKRTVLIHWWSAMSRVLEYWMQMLVCFKSSLENLVHVDTQGVASFFFFSFFSFPFHLLKHVSYSPQMIFFFFSLNLTLKLCLTLKTFSYKLLSLSLIHFALPLSVILSLSMLSLTLKTFSFNLLSLSLSLIHFAFSLSQYTLSYLILL